MGHQATICRGKFQTQSLGRPQPGLSRAREGLGQTTGLGDGPLSQGPRSPRRDKEEELRAYESP